MLKDVAVLLKEKQIEKPQEFLQKKKRGRVAKVTKALKKMKVNE